MSSQPSPVFDVSFSLEWPSKKLSYEGRRYINFTVEWNTTCASLSQIYD